MNALNELKATCHDMPRFCLGDGPSRMANQCPNDMAMPPITRQGRWRAEFHLTSLTIGTPADR